MPDDAGAFYHRATCKREALTRKLHEAEARGFEPGEEARLREQIHDAGYVGD